jgi:hypothetical protein
MPSGNDTQEHEAFRSAVESQYGPYQNAEELIRSGQALQDRGLVRAGLTRPDAEATDEANKDKKKTAGKFKNAPKDATLESACVRGNALIGVFLTKSGDYVKVVTGANDSFESPTGTPEQEAERARAAADAEIAQEAARLRAETEDRIAKIRAEEEAKMASEIAKIQADAAKEVEKASKPPAKKPAAPKKPADEKDS